MRNWMNPCLAALVSVTAGVSIAALPHFLAWAKTGTPEFISTVDETYYLAVASQSYFNHVDKLSDPVFAGETVNVYRLLPFLPGVWAAKLFELGPLGINLMWRILAGALTGLAWYVLFRQRIAHPWVAASLAAILLSDPGLCQGVPLARHASRLMQFATAAPDTFFPGGHWMHLEWRVVSPATTMAYLIVVIWAVQRCRAVPTRGRIAFAGLTYGLLFYVFFYYWTAVGLALLLAGARHRPPPDLLPYGLDRRATRVAGSLLGFPCETAHRARLVSACDRFLPIGRFTEFELPREMLLVTALSLVWSLFRRRDLLFIWSLGTAGLLLANEQILTGLQIENYHWAYVWGPAFSCWLLLAATEAFGDYVKWSPTARVALVVVGLTAFGIGMRIRAVEATRSVDPVHHAHMLAAYHAEFPCGRLPGFVANGVAAGDIDFIDLASILDNLRPLSNWSTYLSPSVSDAELDERVALNDLLQGVERTVFESRQRAFFEDFPMGPCKRDPSLVPVRVAARVAAYDRLRADLPTALKRFAIRYVALRTGNRPDYLTRDWAPLIMGPTWDVWERTSGTVP